MSDPTKQPKGDKLKDTGRKVASKFKKWAGITPKPTPTPSPQPSNQQGSFPGAAILPSNTESAPSHVDNGEDALKGGDTAKTDTPDATQSKPEFDWQAWNIDDNAISELQKWGADHENSKWRILAEKIDQSLKSQTLTALQGFIPDSPFPAKTLVTALLSILKLGIHVTVLRGKVSEFAREAIEYFRTLAEVAGEEPIVKEELKAICMAVDEICKWASEKVKTGFPTDDLGDWSSKFEKAKETFLVPFRPGLF
ncbi:hypothetical protein DFH09DRAFT_172472 [Mycena vulgaris]|nr:hypothetical protein DFH09DRAFT_172472 [Mycena vulgaris]